MGRPGTYVFDHTQSASELERLQRIEKLFDPATLRVISGAGLQKGWKCVEVGAGAGSIARALADAVGAEGSVVAIDLSTRFLRNEPRSNLEIVEGDICRSSLAPATYDLVHARFVLLHVVEAEAALDSMLRLLRPGGWLVLEEPDFSSARAYAGPPGLRAAFSAVNDAIGAMYSRRGLDFAFGARLPDLFQKRGLVDLAFEHEAPIVPGGDPFANMMSLSAQQLREKYLDTGLVTPDVLAKYEELTRSPSCWATYYGTVRACGRVAVSHTKATVAADPAATTI